jgi:glutamate racemase
VTGADRPIGVFDSGVGGLTVVRALVDALPGESILYFGDTARVPYGTKSPASVCRYSREAAAFLMDRGVKLLVVACNTATAHAFAMLREELPIPVVGVIEPAVRAAARMTRNRRIAVIGTPGTIASGVYDLLLRRHVPDARVYAQACPLLVPLVEEGWIGHRATAMVTAEYLQPLRDLDVDVLILGCTHYPLLTPLIADVMGQPVQLVDSGAPVAAEVRRILEARDLLRAGAPRPAHVFTVSDLPLRFRDVGNGFVGDLIDAVEHVHVDGYDRAA